MDKVFAPKQLIDVVMPAHNEAACIGGTIEALFAQVSDLPYRFELVIVDDGSTDATARVVESYFGRYPIRLLRLTRNFGKEAALLAGLDAATGDATIIMDADLQHPVEMIGPFLERWKAGYQCVYGVKRHRRNETPTRRLLARLFYWSLNAGTDVDIVPNALDFRLLDRQVVQALCSLRERVRFTKGLYAWLGFNSVGVPFVPGPRAGGRSRFGTRALLQLSWDGLTSFSDLPLRLSALVGALCATAAVAYGLYIFVRTLVFGVDVPGWATLTVALTLLGGLQMLFLGIIGEYVRNVFLETKQRPNYLVRECVTSASCRQPARVAEWRDSGGNERDRSAVA